MNRKSAGWRRLKFVNESTREAIIGSAVNTTRPMSHGDRNASPISVSRRSRLIFLGAGAFINSLSSTIAIDSLQNALNGSGGRHVVGRPRFTYRRIGLRTPLRCGLLVEVCLEHRDHLCADSVHIK